MSVCLWECVWGMYEKEGVWGQCVYMWGSVPYESIKECLWVYVWVCIRSVRERCEVISMERSLSVWVYMIVCLGECTGKDICVGELTGEQGGVGMSLWKSGQGDAYMRDSESCEGMYVCEVVKKGANVIL